MRSYLNDGDEGADRFHGGSGDPDVQAAFEELEGYLRGDAAGGEKAALPPESLRPDFAELDLPFGAPEKECREAYRRLLKKHHPDRHAKHPENFRAATVKTARLNAAFDRIEDWRKSGS